MALRVVSHGLLLWLLSLLACFAVGASTAGRQTVLKPSGSQIASALHNLRSALEVMQEDFFELWLGTWPTSIDWTAAVMGTHVSAALSSLSHSAAHVDMQLENDINKHFGQTGAFFFGQDHFSLRNQAYDDMLWVVLGWLEGIQFINAHSAVDKSPKGAQWHGQQFVPVFSHRARIFYELAEEGWDWKLCGGGMRWSPNLLPYKNAITNELFIAASVAMYLHFPGDDNTAPFMGTQHETYDSKYLKNAINGYKWLKGSGMKNGDGLYVDGFHIKGYATNHSKTECDERNEMVYTYNQGVILTGLRGLWEGTGNISYIEDGHELVRNVMRATGWKDNNAPYSTVWSGLGSGGILTEFCDPLGSCSQNSHTFKGIFFHHLTAFCAPLPEKAVKLGKTRAASRELAKLHRKSCNEYAPWVIHNGEAALKTRDSKGRFGTWWGANLLGTENGELQHHRKGGGTAATIPQGAVDYRNDVANTAFGAETAQVWFQATPPGNVHQRGDLNDRGRGRTVETQGGGVAISRAVWEFLRHYE